MNMDELREINLDKWGHAVVSEIKDGELIIRDVEWIMISFDKKSDVEDFANHLLRLSKHMPK